MKRLLAIALPIILLTSCTTDGGEPASTPQGDQSASASGLPQVTGELGAPPSLGAPTGAAPTQLVIEDVVTGDGAAAALESSVTVHYTLMAWSTGQIVESSWDGGQPVTFGLNQVILGWQQGIPGMKVGGRRLLVIPPDLGYGAGGAGSIGPNETLIFVVDLIDVAK